MYIIIFLILFIFITLSLLNIEQFQQQYSFTLIKSFPVREAYQGVAADNDFFYAISNQSIAKCQKEDGKVVQRMTYERFTHLNGGTVYGKKLYCTNNPTDHNSIVIFNTDDLSYFGLSNIKEKGSLMWISRHKDIWWGCLAHSGDIVNNSLIIQFNPDWSIKNSWSFPKELTEKFYPYSCSGGAWGSDNLLYCTGHEKAEVYALRLEDNIFKFVRTIPVNATGQGIAWQGKILYTIDREDRLVNVSVYNQ